MKDENVNMYLQSVKIYLTLNIQHEFIFVIILAREPRFVWKLNFRYLKSTHSTFKQSEEQSPIKIYGKSVKDFFQF